MKKKRVLLSLLFVGVVACAEKKKEVGELVTFDTVCDAKYDSVERKGEDVMMRVTMEGYLDAPSMMACGSTCSLNLRPRPDATKEEATIGASFSVGTGRNRMEKLPEKFSKNDIKVRTDDGKVVGAGGKVRVTGARLGSGKTCQIVKIDLVEAI